MEEYTYMFDIRISSLFSQYYTAILFTHPLHVNHFRRFYSVDGRGFMDEQTLKKQFNG